MLRRYPDTDHVTGLRALAATAVIMVHTGAFSAYGSLGEHFTAAGRYGVIIFFVIAGFSVTASFLKERSYASYMWSRIFRIAPLYYAVLFILFAVAWLTGAPKTGWMAQFGADHDLYNLLMHLAFLSFLDYRIAASVVGVEWTLPIEMFWYLLLPVLIANISRPYFVAAYVALVLAAAPLTKLALMAFIPEHGGYAVGWMPFQYGHFFLLGVAAYYLRQRGWHMRYVTLKWVSPFALVLMAVYMALGATLVKDVIAVATLLIIAFHRPDSPMTATLLESAPLLFLGTISYSLYLLHFPLIGYFEGYWREFTGAGIGHFLATLALTTVASTITYLLIERPFNRWGRSLKPASHRLTAASVATTGNER